MWREWFGPHRTHLLQSNQMCQLSIRPPCRFEKLFGVEKRKGNQQHQYTQNISFPEARKIVQSQNQFPTKSYSQVTKSNTETKHNHSCTSCHTILEKLSTLTPENLPKFISELKSSLSESTQPKPSQSQLKQPPKEVATQVAPPQKTQGLNLLFGETKSPSGGLRQSHTPRPRIQLEKTNSKNRFSVLEDEEPMECGVLPPSPTSPTTDGVGQKSQQTPKPQRTKHHK